MIIVLDTNVLVSGLLTPYGAPAEIVSMVARETIQICYDARILNEYQEVLLRPKFEFNREDVEAIVAQFKMSGRPVSAEPLEKRLPHKADEPFLEVLISGKADCLITGNLKHFPESSRSKGIVLTPSEFMQFWRKHRLNR